MLSNSKIFDWSKFKAFAHDECCQVLLFFNQTLSIMQNHLLSKEFYAQPIALCQTEEMQEVFTLKALVNSQVNVTHIIDWSGKG